MIEDNELLADFVEESKENLQVAEEDFLSLEEQGEQADPSIINRAFRCVHSIKGGAGFLGLTNIGELAHAMEALMDLIRQDKLTPQKSIISIMLEGVDVLNTMFEDAANSNDFDVNDIHSRILNIVAMAVSGDKGKAQLEKLQRKDEPAAGEAESTTEPKGTDDSAAKDAPQEKNFLADALVHCRVIDESLKALRGDPQEGSTWLKPALEELQGLKKDSEEKRYVHIYSICNALDELLGEFFTELVPIDDKGLDISEQALDTLLMLLDDPDGSDEINIADAYNQILEITKKFKGGIGLPGEEREMDVKSEQKPDVEAEVQLPAKAKVVLPEKKSQETSPEPVVKKAQVVQPKEKTEKSEVKGESESIRVKVSLLNRLMSLAGEMVLVRNQQLQMIDQADAALRNNTQKLDMVTSELQECVMRTRMQPVGILFNKFNRVVRDLGNKLGKEIKLNIMGGDVELDKSILEALSDPLTHMIRNACDHGIEMPDERRRNDKADYGIINLSAWHEGGQVHIEVRDDGKGIDPDVIAQKAVAKGMKTELEVMQLSKKEILGLVLLPGFSTAEKVSDVSGRGVGMDVVRSNIEKVGGSLELDSVKGKGSAVRLQLPLTLAIIPSLIIRAGEHQYAIPQVNLEELVTLYNQEVIDKIENARGREVFRLREQLLPLLRLKEVLSRHEVLTDEDLAGIYKKYKDEQDQAYQDFLEKKSKSKWGDEKFRQSLTFAVLKAGGTKYGLIVDEVLGTEEIVVKSMHPYLNDLGIYAGATVMGDGRVALILDVMGIAKHGNADIEKTEEVHRQINEAEANDASQSVLLFKYGTKEQFAISLNMVSRIERIKEENFEEVGSKEFITIDGVSTQIIHLDKLLNVSEFDGAQKETFLLLPKMVKKPFGILISQIVDSVETSIELNTDSYMEEGLLGTALINDRMTLFIDMYKVIEKADPNWSERRPTSLNDESPKRILLNEDVTFFRTLVKGYLASEGYEVVTAENGKVGLEEFQKGGFDIIVSDIEMPVMDGFEFMRAVRSILNDHKTPAIALTALDSEDDIKKIHESGYDVYEAKIDKERLLERVAELLEQN